MRSHLSALIASWLLCQVVALAGASFALTRDVPHTAGQVVCSCPGAQPGQACPMHHPDHAVPKPGGFLLQNPCAASSPAALLFLAGGLGIPESSAVSSSLLPSPGTLLTAPARVIGRIEVPDPPPPRA